MGGALRPLEPTSLSAALIVAHVEGTAPDTAVMRLREVVAANSADGFIVQRLDGIEVPERIVVDDNTAIVPQHEIPKRRDRVPFVGSDAFGPFTDPTAAIIRKVTVTPLFEPVDAPYARGWRTDALDDMRDVEHAIAVATSGAAMGLETTGTFMDSVLDAFPGDGSSYFVKARGRFHAPPAPLTGDDARVAVGIIRKFRRHGSSASSIIDILADRIVGARRGATTADKALDLGIALESLLMSGKNDSGEITYKMQTRAAWLLGTDHNSRLLVLDWLRAIYRLRSRVAHGAAPPDSITVGDRTVPVSEALDLGTRICSAVALSVFQTGPSPDWDRIVLGADVPRRDNGGLLTGLQTAGSARGG